MGQEVYKIVLTHYFQDDEGNKVQLDEPIVIQNIYDRMFGNSTVLINEMFEKLKDFTLRKMMETYTIRATKGSVIASIEQLPSAQPEPLLDEIVDEIRKTIAETESNGKYHADSVRHNGEMICHGLQIALNIIEEKRNERSD